MAKKKAEMDSVEKFEAGRSTIRVAVLGMLQKEKMCGYQVAKRLRDANPDLALHFGVLYPLLEQLEKDGYVTGKWEHGRGMKGLYKYSITAAGRKALATSRSRWLKVISQVRAFANA